MYIIIILNVTFKIFCNSPSNFYSNCNFFSCFTVFPYAHKKFSKSKQLAESIDDICNNIWNKKKQRPENHQTGDKQRPENDQIGDKQRPENDQTGDKQRPENDQTGDKQRLENNQTGDKQRPENDQTGDKQRLDSEKAGDKQRPENDQTGDKQRPENDQTGDKQRLEDGHLQGTIGPLSERSISQAGCQPMIDRYRLIMYSLKIFFPF